MDKERIVFLEGKKACLRPVNIEQDCLHMARWFNDQQILQFLGRRTTPITLEEEKKSLERLSTDPDTIFLVITEKGKDEAIGTMGIHKIDWISRTGISGACLDRAHWNGGFGTDAKMVLLHHVFTRLNFRAIGSSVLSINPRSKAYQEKTGYREVGRRESWYFRNGEFVDEIFMEVRKEDFMPLWEKYEQEDN